MRVFNVPDGGKTLAFEINRFSAVEGEEWLWTIIRAIGANLDITQGIDAKTIVMTLAKMNSDDARKALDALLHCCSRRVGNSLIPVDRKDCGGYITNPLTLIALELEAAKENFGFFTEENALRSLDILNISQTAQKSEVQQK